MKALTIFFALLLSVRALAVDSSPDIATTDVCRSVRTPLTEPRRSLRVRSGPVRSDPWKSRLAPVLRLYKDIWQRLCSKDNTVNFSLIYDLYPKVLTALTFASNAPYYSIPEEFAEDWDYRQTAAQLPFIHSSLKPGSASTYNFVFDSKGFFAFADKQGKMEDKTFGYVMAMVPGMDQEPSWSLSAGGQRKSCVKFGEYNWFAAFEILKKAKKYLTTMYKVPLQKIRADLVRVFEVAITKDICSCGDAEGVRADFDHLRQRAGSDPYYADLIEAIKLAQLQMNESDFHFGSYMENSCSAYSN